MMRTSFVKPAIPDPVNIAGNTDLFIEGGVVVVKSWLDQVASRQQGRILVGIAVYI